MADIYRHICVYAYMCTLHAGTGGIRWRVLAFFMRNVYVYVYINVHIHVNTCICIHMTYTHICIFICVYTTRRPRGYTMKIACIFCEKCLRVSKHKRTHTCKYIYIYAYIRNTHTYIYAYMYTLHAGTGGIRWWVLGFFREILWCALRPESQDQNPVFADECLQFYEGIHVA